MVRDGLTILKGATTEDPGAGEVKYSKKHEIEADEVRDSDSGGARSFHEQDGSKVVNERSPWPPFNGPGWSVQFMRGPGGLSTLCFVWGCRKQVG